MKTQSLPAFFLLFLLFAIPTARAAAPSLKVTRDGPLVTVTWGGRGVLETSDNAAGPWQPVASAQSPYVFQIGTGSSFFRVRIPYYQLTVTRDGNGSGTVTSSPEGIQCGNVCAGFFEQNTVVTLTATPGQGQRLASWGGDGAGAEVRQIFMDGPKSVSATFQPQSSGGLINGDFEQGPGIGWVEQPGTLIVLASQLDVWAPSGQYVAWLGPAADNRHSATISQTVTLPQVWPLYLNYWLLVYSEELCDAGYWDRIGFYVNGLAMLQNDRLCRGNTGGDGWRQDSRDLSNFAGQTVTIAFEIASPSYDPLASVALFDSLSLSQTPW